MTAAPMPPIQLPHASITHASFTDKQTISSTPLALILSAWAMNPGRCDFEQVGVKAPGNANTTTFLPLNSSSLLSSAGPSPVISFMTTLGIRSPTLIVILNPPWDEPNSEPVGLLQLK